MGVSIADTNTAQSIKGRTTREGVKIILRSSKQTKKSEITKIYYDLNFLVSEIQDI